MTLRWISGMALAVTIGLLWHSGIGLGDTKKTEPDKKKEPEKKKAPVKDVIVNGELITVDLKDNLTQSYSKSFTLKLEKDVTYQIDLASDAFQPYLRLETTGAKQVEQGTGRPASITYKPAKTEDFQIVVTSQQNGTGKFRLSIRDASLSTVFSVSEKLNQKDAAYKPAGDKKHKLFTVNLEEGKTYQIDMKSRAFDSYLYFESPEGKILAQDDDSGGYPDARIVHKATKTGKYRIIATHFGNGGNLGDFTITVRQTDGEAPRPDRKDVDDRKDGAKK